MNAIDRSARDPDLDSAASDLDEPMGSQGSMLQISISAKKFRITIHPQILD
jgi:hypothetical protein